jgi:DNA topoisomerase III
MISKKAMRKLILTEKPSVAKDIANAIGNGEYHAKTGYIEVDNYNITWAYGHLVSIDDSQYNTGNWNLEELPILPDGFKLKVIKDKITQFNVVKNLLKSCDEFIVATDAGREGELIARQIMYKSDFNNIDNSFRMWTSEALTKEVVLKQMKSLKPLKEFDSLYFSAKARQEADWIVGINLTRLFSVKANTLCSVGRVQTPTLAIIVKRDSEIKEFVPKEYYTLKANFKKSENTFTAKYFVFEKTEKGSTIRDTFSNEEIIKAYNDVNTTEKAKILMVNAEEKKQIPPLLYSLTALQRAANKKFGYSAQKTLDIAQALYEKEKCISYPRTDSCHLAESSRELVKEKLKIFNPELINKVDAIGKRVFDNSKLSDHHALIPLKEYQGTDEKESNIFKLIKTIFLAAFMSEYIYEVTNVVLVVNNTLFQAKGNKIINKGWKELFKNDTEKDEILPELIKEEIILKTGVEKSKNWTKPPSNYTEDTLLSKMDKLGLGTPATRASIIEKIISTKYVGREKKKLISTSKGQELIKILDDSLLKNEDYTMKWENNLDMIYTNQKGYSDYSKFMDDIKTFTAEEIQKHIGKEINIKREASTKQIGYAKKLALANNVTDFDSKNTDFNYVDSFIKKQKEEMEKTEVEKPCLCGNGTFKKSGLVYKCSCDKFVYASYFEKKLTEQQAMELLCGKIIELKNVKFKKAKKAKNVKIKYLEAGRVEFVNDKK